MDQRNLIHCRTRAVALIRRCRLMMNLAHLRTMSDLLYHLLLWQQIVA